MLTELLIGGAATACAAGIVFAGWTMHDRLRHRRFIRREIEKLGGIVYPEVTSRFSFVTDKTLDNYADFARSLHASDFVGRPMDYGLPCFRCGGNVAHSSFCPLRRSKLLHDTGEPDGGEPLRTPPPPTIGGAGHHPYDGPNYVDQSEMAYELRQTPYYAKPDGDEFGHRYVPDERGMAVRHEQEGE